MRRSIWRSIKLSVKSKNKRKKPSLREEGQTRENYRLPQRPSDHSNPRKQGKKCRPRRNGRLASVQSSSLRKETGSRRASRARKDQYHGDRGRRRNSTR